MALLLLEVMLLKLQSPRAKKRINITPKTLTKTFLRLLTIIIIKKAITLKIEPSPKTSYSLGNLYIDNYKFGG